MKHDTVILDLDGTLVDSVYQHVLAWQLAFRDVGLRIRGVDVHAAIGMGGDKLVAHVAGDSAEWAVGDQVREAHDEHFRAFLPTLEEVDGASQLLQRSANIGRELWRERVRPSVQVSRVAGPIQKKNIKVQK